MGIFVLLATIAYGVYQWSERDALILTANQLNTEAATLTAVNDQLTEDYDAIKVEVTAARETATQELGLVFPTNEDLTALTRTLDTWASEHNFEANPFFISSLSYEEAKVSESGTTRYLPLRMSIETSKKNLSKFLEYIESSGSLEGQVRLMSIEDLRIQYPAEFGGSYEVQIELNAYFSQEI